MKLDFEAIQAALRILDVDYRSTDTPLSQQQKDAWRPVLEKLEIGELRPALAHLGYDKRPGPLQVMDVVLEARRTGDKPTRPRIRGVAAEVIAQARKDLNRV